MSAVPSVCNIVYGCQINEYDARKSIDLLKHHHAMQEVTRPELADMIILTTCSIREKAQEKLFKDEQINRNL